MSTVIYPDGSTRDVLNLGWLLRASHGDRWAGKSLIVNPYLDRDVNDGISFKVTSPDVRMGDDRSRHDAVLYAYLRDGRVYRSTFASREALRAWLDRPTFRNMICEWFGVISVIGSPAWRGKPAKMIDTMHADLRRRTGTIGGPIGLGGFVS